MRATTPSIVALLYVRPANMSHMLTPGRCCFLFLLFFVLAIFVRRHTDGWPLLARCFCRSNNRIYPHTHSLSVIYDRRCTPLINNTIRPMRCMCAPFIFATIFVPFGRGQMGSSVGDAFPHTKFQRTQISFVLNGESGLSSPSLPLVSHLLELVPPRSGYVRTSYVFALKSDITWPFLHTHTHTTHMQNVTQTKAHTVARVHKYFVCVCIYIEQVLVFPASCTQTICIPNW